MMLGKMLIDANIFLEIFLEQNKSDNCKNHLRKIQTGEIKAFLSTFTIDTIILSMTRNKVPLEKIKIFLYSLKNFKGLKLYNVDLKDRLMALGLIKKYNLDYEDSITLQSAISSNSKEILSLDKHFDKAKLIKRIEP